MWPVPVTTVTRVPLCLCVSSSFSLHCSLLIPCCECSVLEESRKNSKTGRRSNYFPSPRGPCIVREIQEVTGGKLKQVEVTEVRTTQMVCTCPFLPCTICSASSHCHSFCLTHLHNHGLSLAGSLLLRLSLPHCVSLSLPLHPPPPSLSSCHFIK